MAADLIGSVSATGALTDVGRSLREAFYMFWATLWALVLGFAISGAVQAFVSREGMQRHLGDHRPASVARASLYGMVSSSCSYAASAMARSLFARGADFVAAMVFMFASTNLVIELGIVLLVLIGWQFLAAEFIGGVLMIALLTILGGLWLRGRSLQEARARVEGAAAGHGHGADSQAERAPWRQRVRTAGGWADAATYTMSDLTMLRKEMAIGFLVAGFLTVLVPSHVWSDVFVTGHGFWTSLENVAVGPFVAVISFVCSVGNVPLAAALWKGGISFGGVVAFVFADLITLPLLLIYRKQYGARMAARMLATFWLVMSAAGIATEYLFRAAGWVPASRPGVVTGDTLRWNYTTYLDLLALAAFAVLYVLYRRREHLGGGAGYAKDPVCGMQVEVAHSPAVARHHGQTVYFCSEHCRDRFVADPDRYLGAGAPDGDSHHTAATDPVCGMTVDPDSPHRAEHAGRTLVFCCEHCKNAFLDNPDSYPAAGAPDGDSHHTAAATDPVCGMTVDPDSPHRAEHAGRTLVFCCEHCRDAFLADPDRYGTAKVTDPVCGMDVDPTTAAAHRRVDGRDYWFCGTGCAETFDRDPAAAAAGRESHT